jgi:catechol 2,3-dioxygenase-like lactoylglutathione lyase family enzyme
LIDHIDFGTRDYAASRDFYSRTLAPLGIRLIMEIQRRDGSAGAGFGRNQEPAQPSPREQTVKANRAFGPVTAKTITLPSFTTLTDIPWKLCAAQSNERPFLVQESVAGGGLYIRRCA